MPENESKFPYNQPQDPVPFTEKAGDFIKGMGEKVLKRTYVPEAPRGDSKDREDYFKLVDRLGYAVLQDVVIDPADPGETLALDEVVRRYETDHTVRRAPYLFEQKNDTARTNQVAFIAKQKRAIYDATSNDAYVSKRFYLSEWQAINQTYNYLDTVANLGNKVAYSAASIAAEMRDTATFIGNKELRQACTGIAAYWKQYLDADPRHQLAVISSRITETAGISPRDGFMVKSDDYTLDTVLSNFTDQEMQQYAHRFVLSPKQLKARPSDTKLVIIDDWTISGHQMQDVVEYVAQTYPKYIGSSEINLVAATEARIKKGLIGRVHGKLANTTIPVHAYYAAHNSHLASWSAIESTRPKIGHGAHITGAHSSVDYDWEKSFEELCIALHASYELPEGLRKKLTVMPSLTNIVRPYREGQLQHIQRYHKITK